jgi:hypothetical protein
LDALSCGHGASFQADLSEVTAERASGRRGLELNQCPFFIDNRPLFSDYRMIRYWRLNERTQDNLGLACTEDGLFLGRTPLIERRDQRYVVRERSEIERLLKRAYQSGPAIERLMSGLATVAAALNANDQCLARIAAVHLQIPNMPSQKARAGMEAEDIFIKSTDATKVLRPAGFHKASPDDPEHPGWPKGTEGGLGGKFRPKDGPEAVITQEAKDRIRRLVVRRALRRGALAALRITAEAAANVVPFVGVAADIAMLIDLVNTITEFRALKINADAAIGFIERGPHPFEELQLPSASRYEEFSSYYYFNKDIFSAWPLEKRFGAAGAGYQYHHIVTQGGTNEDTIPSGQLHNTENVIRLPTLLHEAVNAEYLKPAPRDSSMSLYQWLQTQPYEVHREEGLRILRELHILK